MSNIPPRQIYLPFSTASRCALTDWHDVPAFHTCAFAPSFSDDARLVVYTREDFDRWKGLLATHAAAAIARITAWLRGSAEARLARSA